MGDDSSRSIINALKNEWSLFWDAFQKEEKSESEELLTEKPEVMSLDQAREIAKALSEDRKKINQKLESLSKEIELNSAKLEGLRLVGGSEDDTIKRIEELNDLGQVMAVSLAKLDLKLRTLREQENALKEDLATS
ncbi:hypothetical protein [Bdellovibrio sp. HCB2-146]|uniref:hypothetical protein n=1 Tax=Bdellovibrio sp. HCB2-146 TaxID=3394362 RepID=UPI0039BCC8A0